MFFKIAGCATLESGDNGKWWTSVGDQESKYLAGNLLKSLLKPKAHKACQRYCEQEARQQGKNGVCGFKNGYKGQCFFSSTGRVTDYKRRFGWADPNHLASSCN